MDPESDMRKCARGDHTAFARVVVAYQHRIFGYLGRMGFDSATAEDIAQETFIRVWQHAGKFNPALGNLTTWIVTIARNLALSRLTQQVKKLEGPMNSEAMNIMSDEPEPDVQLMKLQRVTRLHAALLNLSAGDRSILSASYIDELDLAAVARIEGCSIGAAKVRLHRARQRLKLILEVENE